MLDIICTRKEKTCVYLFVENYKMVFLLFLKKKKMNSIPGKGCVS